MKHIFFAVMLCCVFFSCSREEELSVEEIEARGAAGLADILAKTVSKPWRGEGFVAGKPGGSWYSVTGEDPKSFNMLIAEQDGSTMAIVNNMHDSLIGYDFARSEWQARIATPEIIVDEEADTLTVMYTLRDDLYWSYYNSDKKIKVTSDDVVFWYNEISGDPDCQSSAYYQQFLEMPDGSEGHVDIEKIDERRFAFKFPRIIAEPLLSTNMDFGPRHIFEPAKKTGRRGRGEKSVQRCR